jgi:hypothetical protein
MRPPFCGRQRSLLEFRGHHTDMENALQGGERANTWRGDSGLNAMLRGATLVGMRTHEQIDQRSLALARAVVDVIDRDPSRRGLEHARSTCRRWILQNPSPAMEEWGRLLERDWQAIRLWLLDPGEEGRRLRQSSPFCGVLSPRERWTIYRQAQNEYQAA